MFKKPMKIVVCLLLLLLSLVVSLFYSNWIEIISPEKCNITLNSNDFQFNNKQLVLDFDQPTNIKNVQLNGVNIDIKTELAIVYKKNNSSQYSIHKNYTSKLIDDSLLISIGKKTTSLKVDFLSIADDQLQIKDIVLNVKGFTIDPIFTMISFFVAIILSILIMVPLTDYKKYSEYLVGFKKYWYLLKNLVHRDITIKYRRSALGVLWSVLNPLLMMLVTTAVFQRLFKNQIENFPVYYMTGSLLFNFVVEATNGALSSVIGNASLIKKVYIPKYIFPLEKCFFALVNMGFSSIAMVIMLLALRSPIHITFLLIPIPVLYTFIFSIGFGLILAALNVYFRDVGHLYSVWTTVWMYLTPLMYPIDILPKAVIDIVKLNPLYHYIEYFRELVIYGTVPSLQSNLICIVYGLLFLVSGVLIFKKTQDRFILFL